MGIFSGEKLHAVHPPLGLLPAFVRDQEETLVLRERVFSFTGVSLAVWEGEEGGKEGGEKDAANAARAQDDFSVKDTKGDRIIKARAKLVSMHDSKGESSERASAGRARPRVKVASGWAWPALPSFLPCR